MPVPVKVHEEKHHDHWGSASNTHEDNWASASSNEEVKPHHHKAKVSAASVPPHRAFNVHGHMMNRMEHGKAAVEAKSTGLLQTLLNNNAASSNEKPTRTDKKSSGGSGKSDVANKKKTASSESKQHDKEKESSNTPQLITHHHLIDPNLNPEMLPPPAAFGLMQPEGMQSAIMQPAFLPPIPMAIDPNEMHQQHLHNQAAAAAAAAAAMQHQQSQQQQSSPQHPLSQQHQLSQQQLTPQQSQQQQQQQQLTLEQQQQMHEAMIHQQLQQLHMQHMQQQFEQHLQNEHQKMQEAMASSIPQPLSQDSPLASQLPIPLPGQVISAPVFEPITNGNQTDKAVNVNANLNGNLNAMPQYNELEIIPYEIQQQLQAAAHLRQFATHASEPHAPLKELPPNRENSLINYNKEQLKEQAKHQQFEHITKGNYAWRFLRAFTITPDCLQLFSILTMFLIFKWIVF